MKNALTGMERSLFWTLAFAAFAAAAAGLAWRAVDRVAAGYEAAQRNYAIVRVLAPEGPAAMAAAEAALSHSPHVASAAPMTAGRAAALLRQWGGGEVAPEAMPALQLIEIELTPAAPNIDVAGDLVAALAQGGVTADVLQTPGGEGAAGAASRIRIAVLWAAAGFALVMALIIWLAARGLAARRRELVTVMADCGATRGQAAGRIADEAAMVGLYAGLTGGVLAGLIALPVLLLALPGASIETLPQMILPMDLAPIVAAPLGAAIAAGFGARAAAGFFHEQAARLD
jgi:cell division transport system permease protein